MPNIGVVSSIPYTSNTKYQKALENNVSGVTFLAAKDDKGDDLATLGQAVKDVITGGANYIVTLGGVNAYTAAATKANNPNIPFFSLIGETPLNPLPDNCWGGVSLESWANNKTRVEYLITKGYKAKGSISLYYNQNSGMWAHETDNWMNTLYPAYLNANGDNILVKAPVKSMKNGNNENNFDSTVLNVTSAAVIVSAHPFHNKRNDKLVAAFNGANIYACYPLKDYDGGNPKAYFATVYDLSIENAIKDLAGVITAALNSNSKQPFTKENPGTPSDKQIMSWWQWLFG
jgi:hypothetical protein